MAQLVVNKVKTGMKLADNVTNSRGGVLFKSGDIITGKHLKAFKAWGITEINIQDIDDFNDTDAEEKSTQLIDEKSKKEIDWLFQKTDKNDPAIKELYRLSIERKIEKRKEVNEDG